MVETPIYIETCDVTEKQTVVLGTKRNFSSLQNMTNSSQEAVLSPKKKATKKADGQTVDLTSQMKKLNIKVAENKENQSSECNKSKPS